MKRARHRKIDDKGTTCPSQGTSCWAWFSTSVKVETWYM